MRRFLLLALPALLLISASAGLFAEDAGAAAPPQQLTLMDLILHGGPIELLLIILSMICYSLALQWTFTLKRETFIPPGMADDVHACFTEGVTDEAVENARNAIGSDTSMLGNILIAALDKRDFGYEAMKESSEAIGISEHNRYMGKVSWLSLFASSATLMGLLGTVSGIIKSFLTMGSNTGAVDPSKLALSIGEALVCTATGLGIAIGALYFFFMLRARVNQAAIDAGVITGEVLDYFRPQNPH
jgi:biopolymer transport protein ExbB